MSIESMENEPLRKGVVVTVSLLDDPETYYYGVMDTYESGDFEVHTNGRLHEGADVMVAVHNESEAPEIENQELKGRVESVSSYSSVDYNYIHMYSIRTH